jgi:hypothetical protein
VKAAYPPGLYPQADWLDAERDLRLRLEEGVPFTEILAGCERYAAQHVAKDGNPQYVLSPKKFFTRRERRWTEAWPLPTPIERRHPEDTGWRPEAGDPKYDPALARSRK